MGKKKVTTQTADDILKENEGVDQAASRTKSSRKNKRIDRGRVYIKTSFNNTLVSVTDQSGNLVAWVSAGSLGFSGPKKATPFASSKIIATLTEKLKNTGPTDIDIFVRGAGGGRDSAIRSLINQGFNILSIKDVTPIPHNGPRPPKPRRV
ncbi:MAG: 30S ribosomal protein S11 [Candidatus Liptonbacteria bacterium]|nr:30S ribosomal protein S11 [Candidatus Liptonbacteria bacterium]